MPPFVVTATLVTSVATAGDSDRLAGVDPIGRCEVAAQKEHNEAVLKLRGVKLAPDGSPIVDEEQLERMFSIERTIAERRLLEGYCLKFASCEKRAGDTDLQNALNFDRCIDDEDEERVLDKLLDGSEAERKEAISRLQRQ